MTQDEIIRMAVECQLLTTANRDGVYAQALERFAALVAAHERESCAKVCEQDEFQIYETAERCAAAIRARSNNG